MSWGVYERMLPEGGDYPYNFATTNAYARYKDLNGLDFQAVFHEGESRDGRQRPGGPYW